MFIARVGRPPLVARLRIVAFCVMATGSEYGRETWHQHDKGWENLPRGALVQKDGASRGGDRGFCEELLGGTTSRWLHSFVRLAREQIAR